MLESDQEHQLSAIQADIIERKLPRLDYLDTRSTFLRLRQPVWQNERHNAYVADHGPKRINKLAGELKYSYTERLTHADNLQTFFYILSNHLEEATINQFSQKGFNFLVHTSKLIIDSYNDQSVPEEFVRMVEPHIDDIRHLLWVLLETNGRYQEVTGKEKWHISLAEEIHPEDLLQTNHMPLSRVKGASEILNNLEILIRTPLDRTPPANQFIVSPGQGYSNKFLTQPNTPTPLLDSEPGYYRQRYDSSQILASIKKFGGLKANFSSLIRLIQHSSPQSSTLELPENPQLTTNGKIQARLLDLPQNIPVQDLKEIIFSTFIGQLSGKPWEDVQSAGLRLIKLLRNAKILKQTDGLSGELAFKPMSQSSLTSDQLDYISVYLVDFMKKHHKEGEKAKELRKAPYYRLLLYMLAFWIMTLYDPVSTATQKIANDPALNKVYFDTKDKFAESLANLGKKISGESLYGSSGLYSDGSHFIRNVDQLFSKFGYNGPENSSRSLSELRANLAEPAFSFKEQRDFLGYIPVQYSNIPGNPYGVWWSNESITRFNEPLYLKTFDGVQESDILLPSLLPANWGNPSFNELPENHLTFDNLLNFDKEDIAIGNEDYQLVDTVVIDLSKHESGSEVHIPIPNDATHIFGLMENPTTITLSPHLSTGPSGIRYLSFSSKSSSSKMVYVFLRQPIKDPVISSFEVYSSSDSPTHEMADKLVVNIDRVFRLPETISLRELEPGFNHHTESEDSIGWRQPAQLTQFIENWGIDYEKIYNQIISIPYDELLQKSYAENSKRGHLSHIDIMIHELVLEAISQQMAENGVFYSLNTDANIYLSSNDVRTYFLAANTVGLDCDGLAFIHSIAANGFFERFPEIAFNGTHGESAQEVSTFWMKNNRLILGEYDANFDNWFSGSVNHARVVMGGPSMQIDFEATSGFSSVENMSVEQLEAYRQALGEIGYQFSAEGEAFPDAIMLASVISGILLSIAAIRIRSARKASIEDKKRAVLLGRLEERKEKKNKPIWLKLVPKLRSLNERQLAILPEYLNLLLQEDFLPPENKRRLSQIDYRISAIHSTEIRQPNRPALDTVQNLTDLMSLVFQEMPLNPSNHQIAKRALKIILADENKRYLSKEKVDVLEAIQLLLSIRV